MTVSPIEIAAQIRPALTRLSVNYFRNVARSPLTGPQLSILARLVETGNARISDIAREEGIRMPTASNAIHQMEERGLVERIADPNDRRGVRVAITEFGEQEYQRVGEERVSELATMFANLTPEELELLQAAVPVIKQVAETYQAPRT